MAQWKGSVRVDECSLREDGDSLRVGFRMRVDRKGSPWFAGTLFTPVLSVGDPSAPGAKILSMPDIMLLGWNKKLTYERSVKMLPRGERETFKRPATVIHISKLTDTLIYYRCSTPYEMWMDTARFTLYKELIGFRDNRHLVTVSMDNRVQLAPRIPYQVKPRVNFCEPAAAAKSRTKQGSAHLDFQVAKSAIIPTYRRNPQELAKIHDAFNEIQSDKDVTITGLFIEGYASPEGRWDSNEKLSRERAIALKDYIVNNFHVRLRGDLVHVQWVAEDWDGLRTEIAGSEIARRDKILDIIDNTPDIDARKTALKQLGTTYQTLLNQFFPPLRRVEYQIDYTVKDFTMDESRDLVGRRPEMLSQRELYNLAQSYGPGSKEGSEILLDVIPKYFPGDATAAVNEAAVMIRGGESATAKRLLEKFADNPLAWNNLGVACMLEGDLDGAGTFLRLAQEQGVPEAKANLAELQTKREDNIRLERRK